MYEDDPRYSAQLKKTTLTQGSTERQSSRKAHQLKRAQRNPIRVGSKEKELI